MGARNRSIVLLVEDEVLVRLHIAGELRHAGWEVVECSTAEAALALLQAGRHIDIVLTDIQLAGALSGWDVVDGFRVARPDMPVIYTSGNLVDHSRQVEGSLFFSKPYQPAAILQACRTFI